MSKIERERIEQLIEGLRTGEVCTPPCKAKEARSGCTCAAAADEIETLRAALERAEIDVNGAIVYVEGHEHSTAHGLRQTLGIIQAALGDGECLKCGCSNQRRENERYRQWRRRWPGSHRWQQPRCLDNEH